MSCSEQPTRDRSAARSNTHNASPEVALAEHDRPRHATVLPGGGSAAERCDVYQIRYECLSLRRVAVLRKFVRQPNFNVRRHSLMTHSGPTD